MTSEGTASSGRSSWWWWGRVLASNLGYFAVGRAAAGVLDLSGPLDLMRHRPRAADAALKLDGFIYREQQRNREATRSSARASGRTNG